MRQERRARSMWSKNRPHSAQGVSCPVHVVEKPTTFGPRGAGPGPRGRKTDHIRLKGCRARSTWSKNRPHPAHGLPGPFHVVEKPTTFGSRGAGPVPCGRKTDHIRPMGCRARSMWSKNRPHPAQVCRAPSMWSKNRPHPAQGVPGPVHVVEKPTTFGPRSRRSGPATDFRSLMRPEGRSFPQLRKGWP